MKAKSCFSTNMDPYRAGTEIGEALAGLRPEVIFLFSTIHYDGSPELVEAIYDALGSDDTVLIGNTGDGFYERDKIADAGVSALGINTGGSASWYLASEPGVGTTPFEATSRCLARLHEACGSSDPSFYFLAADFRTDTSKIVSALRESARGPVIGGSAADDYSMKRCFVHANRQTLADSVAMLAVTGAIRFDIHVAHNLQPVGRAGEVTESESATVHAIDNIAAMDFIERELGKPLAVVDEGIMAFKLTEQGSRGEHRVLSLLLPDDEKKDSGVKLFGGVEQGNLVQVCLTPPDRMIQDVKDIGDSLGTLPFNPVAALIVSCAGRKKVLAGEIDNEVRDILHGCPSLEALSGFPSFGEFGPVKTVDGYSRPLFHNMTFILLLIGAMAE